MLCLYGVPGRLRGKIAEPPKELTRFSETEGSKLAIRVEGAKGGQP